MQFQSGQEDHWAGTDQVDASDNFSVGQMGRMDRMGRMGRMGQISQMDIGGASGPASQGRPLVMPARSQAQSSYPQNHSLYAMPEPSTNRYVPMPLDQQDHRDHQYHQDHQDHQDPQDPLGPATGMGQGPGQGHGQSDPANLAGPLDHHLPVVERILQHATLVLQASAELDQHLGGQGPQLYAASGAYHPGQPHQLHQPHPSNGQGPVAKDRYSQVHAQLEGAVQQLARCTPSGAGLTGQHYQSNQTNQFSQSNQTSKTRGLVRPGQRANGSSGIGGVGGFSGYSGFGGYGGSGTQSRFDKLCQEVLRTKQKLWQADLQMLCRAVPCRSWATHSAVGPAGPPNLAGPPDPKRARSLGGQWNVMDSDDDDPNGRIGSVMERLETQAREAAGLAQNAMLELDQMHVSNADILDTYGSDGDTNLSTLLGHLASAAVDNEMDAFATTHKHMQEAIEFLQEQVHALQDPNLIGVKNLAVAIAHLNKAPVSTFMSTDCEQLVYDTLERATRMLSTLKEKFEQVDRSFIEAHEAIQADVGQQQSILPTESNKSSTAPMFGRSRFSGPEFKNGTVNPAKDWMTFEQYHVEHAKQVERRRLEILMALFRVTDPAVAKERKQPGRNGDATLGTTLSATPTWEKRMASLVNLIEANEDAVLSCTGDKWSINQDWVKALAAKTNPNYLATLLQLLPEYGMTQHLWDVYRTHVFGYSQLWLGNFKTLLNEPNNSRIVKAHNKLYEQIHKFWNSFHSWCHDSVWVHTRDDVETRILTMLQEQSTISEIINPWIEQYYDLKNKITKQQKALEVLIKLVRKLTEFTPAEDVDNQTKIGEMVQSILHQIDWLYHHVNSTFHPQEKDDEFAGFGEFKAFTDMIGREGIPSSPQTELTKRLLMHLWKFANTVRGDGRSRRMEWQWSIGSVVGLLDEIRQLVIRDLPKSLEETNKNAFKEAAQAQLGVFGDQWDVWLEQTKNLNNKFDEIQTESDKTFEFSFDADLLQEEFTQENFRRFIRDYLILEKKQMVRKLKEEASDVSARSVQSIASGVTNLVFLVASRITPNLLKNTVDEIEDKIENESESSNAKGLVTKYINALTGRDIGTFGPGDSGNVPQDPAMPNFDFANYRTNLTKRMTLFLDQLNTSYERSTKNRKEEWPRTDNLFQSVQAMAKQARANGYLSDVCTSYNTFFDHTESEKEKEFVACIWDKARDAYWMLVSIVEMSNQGIRLEGHIRAQINLPHLMHSSEIMNNLEDMSIFNRYEAADSADSSGLFKAFFFDVALAKVFSTTNKDSVKYMTKLQSMVYKNMELRSDYLQEDEKFTQAMYAQAFAILCGLTLKLLFDMINFEDSPKITEGELLNRVKEGEFFELCLEAMKHSGNSVTEIIRPLVANRALLMNIEKATPDVFTGGTFGYQEHSLALLRQYNLSKWAGDVMGDLGRFQGPDPCMPQAIVSLLQNMVFQKQHDVLPFERQVLPLFDAGGMIRSAIDQMYIVSLAQEVFSDLLNKHPQLRHPQMALEVMYTEKYNDFYAEFVQLVNMQEQLTKRYAGTKVTYAQDARAVAQRYRTMCFVFKHAKVTVMGRAVVPGPVYLLDSRVPVAPNRTETGEGPLACHTCEMLVRGNLMASYRAKREQERRLHQQDVDWQKTHLREMQVLSKQLQKAKVDYQVARTEQMEQMTEESKAKQPWKLELEKFKAEEAKFRAQAIRLNTEQKMEEVARTNKNVETNQKQRSALMDKFNEFKMEMDDRRKDLKKATDEESKMLKAELDIMLKQQEQITKLLSSNPKQWFR